MSEDYLQPPVTITLDEGQRQLTLQALAIMAAQRPAYEPRLREIAALMDDDRLAVFTSFKLLSFSAPRSP